MLGLAVFGLWVWTATLCLGDIFLRQDIGGFRKAIWTLIIFLPLLGALIYLIVYHDGIAERRARSGFAGRAAFEQQVGGAVVTGGPATEIETARRLLEAGAITQAEFDTIKTRR